MKKIILFLLSMLAILTVQYGCESDDVQEEQERTNGPIRESGPETGQGSN